MTKLYIANSNAQIDISKTSDGEFIAYTTSNGTYKNILVDEDGDIELLIIPINKCSIFNKRFFKEDGLNFSTIVSSFNEMR